jgi:transmembrane sensor
MSTQPPIKGPLEQHLDPVLDDARVQSLARSVHAARHAPARPMAPRFALAVSTAVGFSLAWFLLRAPEQQAITMRDGSTLPAKIEGQRELKFSDGSWMQASEGTIAEVVANQPAKVTLLLRRGKARFEVNPGSHRQWLVEAGGVTVEVVGTIFTVDRGPKGVDVSVERGTVLVRGDGLPDRLVRLDAGKSVFVAPAVIEAAVVAPSVPEVQAAMPVAPVVSKAEPRPLAPVAMNRAPQTVEELLGEADVQRAAGRYKEAAQALEKLLEMAPLDPNAATAAFTLGRLELEKLQQPAAAAQHFELASQNALLAEDALARRVEALVAADQKEAAREAARDVLHRFPTGAHATALQRWLADPEHNHL